MIDLLARFLPAPYRDAADRCFSVTLAGATGTRPRWLRAMTTLDDAMGDALGQLYVQLWRSHTMLIKSRCMTIMPPFSMG